MEGSDYNVQLCGDVPFFTTAILIIAVWLTQFIMFLCYAVVLVT